MANGRLRAGAWAEGLKVDTGMDRGQGAEEKRLRRCERTEISGVSLGAWPLYPHRSLRPLRRRGLNLQCLAERRTRRTWREPVSEAVSLVVDLAGS